MREEYDIESLNPRKNLYSKRLKKQITINIDSDTVDFFKEQSEVSGIPYQTLINLYLLHFVLLVNAQIHRQQEGTISEEALGVQQGVLQVILPHIRLVIRPKY